MATATVEAEKSVSAAPRDPAAKPEEGRKQQKLARKSRDGERRKNAVRERFFLGTGNASGIPSFGQEMESENEAMLASFKTGANFFVVTEWSTVADTARGAVTLRKEPVRQTL
ncbi:MAG: hypothetical protein WAM39_28640 [Bryobacteraceae bacterium]